MLTTFLLWVFLSSILLILIHFALDYMKKSFSVKNIIHLGRFKNEKYDEILKELKKIEVVNEDTNITQKDSNMSVYDMKNSLIEYVKKTQLEMI